jgi:hypothetical protein
MKSIFLAVSAAFVPAGEEYERLKDVEATRAAGMGPKEDEQ